MAHKNIGLKSLQALFKRHEFERLANRHCTTPKTRKLSHWQHFWFWVYASTNQVRSLRDGVTQFNQHPEKFSQLGFGGEFKLSTLSEANSHRTSVLYEKMFLSKLSMLKAKHQRAFAFTERILPVILIFCAVVINFPKIIPSRWSAYPIFWSFSMS